MHDLDGCSMPEIAEALGEGLNTLYSRLRLARRAVHGRRPAAAEREAAMTCVRSGQRGLGALPADVAELLARGSGHVETLESSGAGALAGPVDGPRLARRRSSAGGPQASAPSLRRWERRTGRSWPSHSRWCSRRFALGLGSGAVLHGWLRTGAPGAVAGAAAARVAAAAGPPARVRRPRELPPARALGAPPRKSPLAPRRARPTRDAEDNGGLGRERALLDQARAALVGGDPAGRWPLSIGTGAPSRDGRLAEERDVLRVQALLAAGRHARARADGRRLFAQAPRQPVPAGRRAGDREDGFSTCSQ